jgi:hypothetical protein
MIVIRIAIGRFRIVLLTTSLGFLSWKLPCMHEPWVRCPVLVSAPKPPLRSYGVYTSLGLEAECEGSP